MSTSTTMGYWPAELPAVQMRIVRLTARLDDITAFDDKILGLRLLHRSEYDDWTVVMFGRRRPRERRGAPGVRGAPAAVPAPGGR
jgi:hypothetical protein